MTATDLDDQKPGWAVAPTLDPAPDPVLEAQKAATRFVEAISSKALLAMKDRRDQIDTVMTNMQNTGATLSGLIAQFARFSDDAIKVSEVIQQDIENANLPFKSTPFTTLTDLSTRKQGT